MKKTFKSLDEQIEILKYKGLVINDENYAKEILLRENYFFINGYRHLFVDKNGRYLEGATFEELYSLFLFDRNFRNIIFKYLLIVENNLKSIISYQLSKKYGYRESDYLQPKNFDTSVDKIKQVNDILKKMKRQVRANASGHTATYHYMNNYGYIPLWIMVKVLSFGIVGELFSILKKEDKEAIANMYGLSSEVIESYLPILSNYRNLCAHEEVVFENRTQRTIGNTIYHSMLNIEKIDGEYKYGKNDIFALIIILRDVLTNEDFTNMMFEIERLINNFGYNLHTISVNDVMNRMGFPENYMDIKNIFKKVDK